MTPLFRLPSPCASWSVKRQHVSSLVLRATSRRHLSQVITPSLCVGAFAFHPFISSPWVLHYTHIKRLLKHIALIMRTDIECLRTNPHVHVGVVSSASSSRNGCRIGRFWRLSRVQTRQEVSNRFEYDGLNTRTIDMVHRKQEVSQHDSEILDEMVKEMEL